MGQLADALAAYTDFLEDEDDEDVDSFVKEKHREADAIVQVCEFLTRQLVSLTFYVSSARSNARTMGR